MADEQDMDSLNELSNEFEVMSCMGRHPNIVWLQGTCNRMLEETSKWCKNESKYNNQKSKNDEDGGSSNQRPSNN